MLKSKVDQYIVCLEGKAQTVWATRDQALRSATRLHSEKSGRVVVIKQSRRGLRWVVADSLLQVSTQN